MGVLDKLLGRDPKKKKKLADDEAYDKREIRAKTDTLFALEKHRQGDSDRAKRLRSEIPPTLNLKDYIGASWRSEFDPDEDPSKQRARAPRHGRFARLARALMGANVRGAD